MNFLFPENNKFVMYADLTHDPLLQRIYCWLLAIYIYILGMATSTNFGTRVLADVFNRVLSYSLKLLRNLKMDTGLNENLCL